MENKTVRVLIVGNDVLLRNHIQRCLKQHADMALVGSYSNTQHALRDLPLLQPDTVFLDLLMPGMSALEFLWKFRIQKSHCRVVVLSPCADDNLASLCIGLGAHAFLPKTATPKRLFELLSQAPTTPSGPSNGASTVQPKDFRQWPSPEAVLAKWIRNHFVSRAKGATITALRVEIARAAGYRVNDFAHICLCSRSALRLWFGTRFGLTPRGWLAMAQNTEIERLL